MVSQWKKIERYVYSVVALSLFVLVIVSTISYRNLVRIQSDFSWVAQTRKNLLELSHFMSNLKDAEIGQREYILTGQESYLEPFHNFEKVIKHYFSCLHTIAANNDIQQKKMEVLEELVNKKLAELQELITLQKGKGAESAKNAILSSNGKKIMDDIQILLLGMDKDEMAILTQHSERIALMVKMNNVIRVTGVVIILLITMLIISHARYLFTGYKKMEEENLEMATTDGLTGLINRRRFFDILEREILQSKIRGHSLTVIMLDIDHFKSINDTYGHLCGDEILKQISRIIRENVYPLDVVARYGGDELIILMPRTSPYEALKVSDRLRRIIDQYPWKVSDKQISVTVSMGLSNINSDNLQVTSDFFEQADKALYTAKHRGRNCVVCYDGSDSGREQQELDNKIYCELQTKVASLTNKLNSQALDMILAFTRAMEMSIEDPYIIEHGKNVCIYANAIAEEMQLSSEMRERIGIAAMLLNLGEITIPNYIRKKTTSLTQEDWKIVKQHPITALRILEPLGIFDLEQQIIKHHHERFDGTGYPMGLKGKEIPIGSRILAVADTFDAITSNYSYKPSLTYNSALEEISRCCGIQFDPAVVEAFCKIIERCEFEIEQKKPVAKSILN